MAKASSKPRTKVAQKQENIMVHRCYTPNCKSVVTHKVTTKYGTPYVFYTCAEHIPGSKHENNPLKTRFDKGQFYEIQELTEGVNQKRIELKKLKMTNWIDHWTNPESYLFTADLYIDGKKVGTCENAGQGISVYPADAEGRKIINELINDYQSLQKEHDNSKPDMSYQPSIITEIQEFVQQAVKSNFLYLQQIEGRAFRKSQPGKVVVYEMYSKELVNSLVCQLQEMVKQFGGISVRTTNQRKAVDDAKGLLMEFNKQNSALFCEPLLEETKANARLIAAAPELLEALQQITHECELHELIPSWSIIMEEAKNAIKKATC